MILCHYKVKEDRNVLECLDIQVDLKLKFLTQSQVNSYSHSDVNFPQCRLTYSSYLIFLFIIFLQFANFRGPLEIPSYCGLDSEPLSESSLPAQ